MLILVIVYRGIFKRELILIVVCVFKDVYLVVVVIVVALNVGLVLKGPLVCLNVGAI